MAEINLLKQNQSSGNFWTNGPKIFVYIFIGILVLAVVYYAWLVIEAGSVKSKIVSAQASLDSSKQTALSMQKRSELFTRQAQIQDLESLIASHPYWSKLLPELARVTLKTATYNTLQVKSQGDLVLDVSVPTLADMDKYMQVFDMSDFNKYFSNLTIGGFTKIQNATSTAIRFQVKMNYDPSLLQYGGGNN